MRRTWVEIKAAALLHNLEVAKRKAMNAKIISVVKANAYGHDATIVARVIDAHTDWYAVDSFEEAEELRETGTQKPILILGSILKQTMCDAIGNGYRLGIGNMEALKELTEIKSVQSACIHLKIESGTMRQGFRDDEITSVCDFIKTHHLHIEGAYSHFADVEEDDLLFAREQYERFKHAVNRIEGLLNIKLIKHISSSAAIFKQIGVHEGSVRLGIGLYGLWPSESAQAQCGFELQPVLSLKTRIVQVKDVRAGETVGYDRTHTMKTDGRIAILPVGYYDGVDRRMGNQGEALIEGRRLPIVGRICMNMCMVDVTKANNVRRNHVVTLLGTDGSEKLTAEEVAKKIGTIHYELVTRIPRHLPRIQV